MLVRTLRSTPMVLIFWLISFVAVIVLWRFMPSAKSQIALLLLLGFVVLSTLWKQTELPILTTIFLSLGLISYWQVIHPAWPIIGAVATALVVPMLGLAGEKINRSNAEMEDHHLVSRWLLLGLISAEALTIFSYWPISFFNRSLLTGIFFYTFWQFFRLQETSQTRGLIAHFAFVSVAVILVLGVILWANFPHLVSF